MKTAPLPEVSISDHALLRYMERVVGIDVARYKLELLAITLPAASIGAKGISKGDWYYPIANHRVISVVPNISKASARREQRVREGRSK